MHKLIERKYLLTFIVITSLFALWGFANDITNPMVAAFQTLMERIGFASRLLSRLAKSLRTNLGSRIAAFGCTEEHGRSGMSPRLKWQFL